VHRFSSFGAFSSCVVLAFGCAGVKRDNASGQAGTSGSAGTTAAAGTSGAGGVFGAAGVTGAAGNPFNQQGCVGPCTDFPTEPIIDTGAPADAPTMFGGAPTGPGPCVTEPEDGAMFPNNWLRPRVKFKATTPGTLHEIRIHADLQANDLVAYTTNEAWTMPKAIWLKLALHVRNQPITVTVRAAGGGASSVKFYIAPVKAEGSIVFWAADPAELGTQNAMTSNLQGFAIGDESTVTALRVADVQMQTRLANNNLRSVKCIGCHNSTPDGASVGFIDLYPWNMAIAGVEPGRTGLLPAYVTPGGTDTIRQPGMGIFSFSAAHWRTGDRIAVAPYYLDQPCGQYDQNKANVRLAWLDLEAPPVTAGCPVEGTHFGIIARTGDARGAGNPTWSHDGKTIVYSSTNAGADGRLEVGATDLYQVPYNNRQGGTATPLMGAADPAFEEYYPSFSHDDKLVAFDRVPAGGRMYANPMAELYVVPASGAAKPTRLAANDPPACSGFASPGVNNHWAKWSPAMPGASNADGKTYYWLIFSSNRYGTPPVGTVQVSQLYATAIVVSEDAPYEAPKTYPAIYLWNQKVETLNTTPAWDPFKIPVVP
jgi:hypothetical protein